MLILLGSLNNFQRKRGSLTVSKPLLAWLRRYTGLFFQQARNFAGLRMAAHGFFAIDDNVVG